MFKIKVKIFQSLITGDSPDLLLSRIPVAGDLIQHNTSDNLKVVRVVLIDHITVRGYDLADTAAIIYCERFYF